MDLKHLHEDIRKAERDVRQGRVAKGPGPLTVFFLSLFLVFILVMMIVPYYAIKTDPSPKDIPSLREVVPDWLESSPRNHTADSSLNLRSYMDPIDPAVKLVADRIAANSCPNNDICYAKALFYFVRDSFQYVPDPNAYEYIKDPKESLMSQGGDCDDASVLLASLLESVGIDTRFVLIPGHVYVEAYLPDARKKYRGDDDMVALDATCASCEFGDVPLSTPGKPKIYLD